MTLLVNGAVLVREAEAETLSSAQSAIRLLADSSHTGGALSTQRVTLGAGANGATPHLHTASTELFFVLDGRLQVLAGDEVHTANTGDLLVVPPNRAHAFAAAQGSPADLLIVITPGVERFDYFRLLERLGRGEATLEELLANQERFDNHFLQSEAWDAARA
ncbi:cupin domain-containing protein [Kitasatospora sp. LaBMicrA B282]|uniref:cupin domain-containing protein n=1 Tax=Kitasatospora sp. LaBMicrA B282 TaxID=3420949 RepID=UPI003D11DD7E